MRISPGILAVSVGVALLLTAAAAPRAAARDDAVQDELYRRLGSLRGDERARAMSRLAWSADDSLPAPPQLAARARAELIGWGKNGLTVIKEALDWAHRRYSADIVAAAMEAEAQMRTGRSQMVEAVIDTAIWYGSPDAKRLAMQYQDMRPSLMKMLPIIDAAHEFPQLTPVVLESLAAIRSDRARFYLAEVVERGTPEERDRALRTMASIGGQCLEYLRAWALGADRERRELALSALLPVANVADLTTLYEYVELYPEDDPDLLARLRERAGELEAAVQAQQELDSASNPLDD